MPIVDGEFPTEIWFNGSEALTGDSVAVCMAEDPMAGAEWTVALYVKLHSGTYVVAEFRTQAANTIKFPNRIICKACIPGALGWMIVPTCNEAPGRANFEIHSSKYGGAPFFELVQMPLIPP